MAEKYVGGREMTGNDFHSAEEIFFGRRPVLGRCGSGSKKDVYARKIVVIYVQYQGCYVIVDNGYLKWSVTIPPMKRSMKRSEIRFSEWIESLRKDVECTFGILKCRWRVLKHGIRLHGIESCDRFWLTWCALHNLLLDEDGLSTVWEAEPDSQFFAVQRFNNPSVLRDVDISGMGVGNDCVSSDVPKYAADVASVPVSTTGHIKVNDLSMDEMRQRLVCHFNIVFTRTTRSN